MKAKVVIGANYGDEGKGLVTDFLASMMNGPTAVIRYNGGAQAGHTVQLKTGERHIFSHFASGEYAAAQSYMSEFFIANPILFKQELEKLNQAGLHPQLKIHPNAIVTTPYDMYVNQIFEESMGIRRHGSCGVGINETVERNLDKKFRFSVNDLLDNNNITEKILLIKNEWAALRIKKLLNRSLTEQEANIINSDEIFDCFMQDIEFFLEHLEIAEYDKLSQYKNLIFEGAQGLLLDQHHSNYPHVTRSNTGIEDVSTISSMLAIEHLDIYYVTRCYYTRHGSGPLENEIEKCPCENFYDGTNVKNKFQGQLRFAPINFKAIATEIKQDLKKLSANISAKIFLVVTCLDHIEESIPIINKNGVFIDLSKAEFLDYLKKNTEFDECLLSYGPTRETIIPLQL